MINYELAKKLKEAGYSQEPKEGKVITYQDDGMYYHPTLSELIEACPKEIEVKGMKMMESFKIEYYGGEWIATYGESFGNPEGKGQSPEEAVANLWLELNKQ